jgi:hypothetical protein
MFGGIVSFEGSDPLLGHAVINNAIVIATTDRIDRFFITFVPVFFPESIPDGFSQDQQRPY